VDGSSALGFKEKTLLNLSCTPDITLRTLFFREADLEYFENSLCRVFALDLLIDIVIVLEDISLSHLQRGKVSTPFFPRSNHMVAVWSGEAVIAYRPGSPFIPTSSL
jgi:hypothetical protein